MENVTLESVAERLDRLEKVIVNINTQLSLLVEQLVTSTSENSKTSEEATAANTQDEKEDANNIGVKIIEEILERMGYPPDFDPGPIEELRESMRQHGIRAEDNEFSRAIIEERENKGAYDEKRNT